MHSLLLLSVKKRLNQFSLSTFFSDTPYKIAIITPQATGIIVKEINNTISSILAPVKLLITTSIAPAIQNTYNHARKNTPIHLKIFFNFIRKGIESTAEKQISTKKES